MAEDNIKRKDLLKGLDKLKLNDFKKAAERLGFDVTQPSGGSSHYAVRKPDFEKSDVRGRITIIYKKMHKQNKPEFIKRMILVGGVEEDDVWEALGLLKKKDNLN